MSKFNIDGNGRNQVCEKFTNYSKRYIRYSQPPFIGTGFSKVLAKFFLLNFLEIWNGYF